ncbi:elongation factor 2 [Artemisia annua]|uniref:Elongation factor 2 n=1 Tax=Artemisia annua TaxID=35608 RepID=A0A2U1QHJ9_ARTAN|nr:elongation factor 2 [Artemisia annua]
MFLRINTYRFRRLYDSFWIISQALKNPVKWEAITVAGDCLKILMLLHTSSKAAESHTSLMSLLLEAIVMVLLAPENDSSQEVRELKTASVRLVSQLAHSQTSVGYFKDALLWMPSTRRQKLQIRDYISDWHLEVNEPIAENYYTMEKAPEDFDGMGERNVASWNAMVAGFTEVGLNVEAFMVFYEMHCSGFFPDEFTLGSVLRGCAGLKSLIAGWQVHADAVKSGVEINEKCTAEKLRRIMDCKRNIRNVSVIGHVDHGKSTLTDNLLAAANVQMTNTTERSITVKSSAFSLHYADCLINLIDSPGHTDFSSEVTAALRITDGAIVVVDCIEGVCVGTDAVLRQALIERIHPVLTLNKMDKCFLELKNDSEDGEDVGEDAYQTFNKAIDMANDIINANTDSDLGDVAFHPNKGNVAFSSGLQGWAFTLADFAKILAKNFGFEESLMMERLWGENYYDTKTKKWTDVKTNSSTCKRGFVRLCYDPIKKIIEACMNDEKKDLFVWLEKLDITMKDDEKKLMHEELVKCVMQKWFPAAKSVYKMMIDHLPSPETAQKYRVGNLYNGSLDDIYAKAIKECDPEGPLMFYVSKMIPASGKGSFFAFGRVFAGKVSTGLKVRIMGSDYHHLSETVEGTVICMGTEQETVQDVPCGNIVALVGLDQFITKSATLTNHDSVASPIHNMKFTVSPVMRVCIKCNSSDRAKLRKGLDLLYKSDLMAEYTTTESGEHFIAGSGELHLEMCVKDLRLYSRNIEIDVSDSEVFYRETDLEEQFLEPVYLVEFQAPKRALPAIYHILNERKGTQFEEMHREGTPLVNVKAIISVKESFGLSSAVKDKTYGQASSQCVDWGCYDPLDPDSWI